jgi:hypothetical protein
MSISASDYWGEKLMQLREYLSAIGHDYDASAGFDTISQKRLAQAAQQLVGYGPADFVIRASGGQRPLGTTDTPWIGFFDPDESTKPQQGLYAVWILQADGGAWTLSVMMGTERLSNTVKEQDQQRGVIQTRDREARVRELLSIEAASIRDKIASDLRAGWDTVIDLKRPGTRQLRYEAATVLARTYPVHSLPSEDILRADLAEVCLLLQEAVKAKHQLAVVDPGSISTASAVLRLPSTREYIFDPGIDRKKSIALRRRSIERTPRHEGGLRRYGEWLIGKGFKVATNVHPRDFIVQGSPEWIGEYKVVYGTDVARATREAHSQLKEYRHFLYPDHPLTPLLAVFSAAVPDRRIQWLNAEGIAVVWLDGVDWQGCPLAKESGLGL